MCASSALRADRSGVWGGNVATIRMKVAIYDVDGYDADRIRDDFEYASYTKRQAQYHDLTGSEDEVEIDVSAVVTVTFLYINSGTVEITVYKNADVVGWTFTGAFLAQGISITALRIVSEEDSTPYIYIAG